MTISKVWTFEELQAAKADKKWVIWKDGVYDVKYFVPYHPGGELIITHLLYTDISDHFEKFHPAYAVDKLKSYSIGVIDEKTFPPLRSKSEFAIKFRLLEEKM